MVHSEAAELDVKYAIGCRFLHKLRSSEGFCSEKLEKD